MVDFSKPISFGRSSGAGTPDAPGSPASGVANAPAKTKGRGKKAEYPTKTTINLVSQEAVRGNNAVQIALFVIAVVLIAIFAKFAVADPLASSLNSSADVAAAQQRLAALEAENADYAAVNERYARYVVTGLTEEEQALADRNTLIDLVESKIMGVGYLQSIKVVGNQITATSVGVDLTEVSRMVESLETDKRVSHVTVSTAQGENDAGTKATIEVTLKSALETDAEALMDEALGGATAGDGAAAAGAATDAGGSAATARAAGSAGDAAAAGKEAGNGAA